MVMKKYIVPNFSFYIYKKINIQKIHKMNKKTKNQTNIFLSWKNYLFFYLIRERTRSDN